MEEKNNPSVVLIIDDEKINLLMVDKLLQLNGFQTICACSGEEALSILSSQKPDLILLDIQMQGMDGYTTAREIKDLPELANVPIIFLSARGDEQSIVKGFQSGGMDYIPKPFYNEELVARVKTHVNLKTALERLRTLSITDELTGLCNRRHFLDQLNREIQRSERYQLNMSLLLLDIDKFKSINDSFGHQIGDEALVRFSDALKQIFRQIDILGRLGGDEFAVIMPETDTESAAHAGERFRQTISGNEDFTVSIGLISFDPHKPVSSIELIRQADMAVYRAKSQGRNQVAVVTPE